MPQQPNSINFVSGEDPNLVGVGIVFQPTEDGTLYVKRLKDGEPAVRSGLIQVSFERQTRVRRTSLHSSHAPRAQDLK